MLAHFVRPFCSDVELVFATGTRDMGSVAHVLVGFMDLPIVNWVGCVS